MLHHYLGANINKYHCAQFQRSEKEIFADSIVFCEKAYFPKENDEYLSICILKKRTNICQLAYCEINWKNRPKYAKSTLRWRFLVHRKNCIFQWSVVMGINTADMFWTKIKGETSFTTVENPKCYITLKKQIESIENKKIKSRKQNEISNRCYFRNCSNKPSNQTLIISCISQYKLCVVISFSTTK